MRPADWAWLAIVAGMAVVLPPAARAAGEPPRVASIELRVEGRLGRPVALRDTLAFGVGDALTEAVVRRTLDNLYATGLIVDAALYTRPADDAGRVAAVVVARAHRWVQDLRLEGHLGLPLRELQPLIEQRVGAAHSPAAVVRSREALHERYRRAGYRQASIAVQQLPQTDHRIDVVFVVDSGPRARIGDIRFVGPIAPFTADELVARLRAVRGTPYQQQRLQRDVERLRASLAEDGYLQARVEPPAELYDPVDDVVELVYSVAVGPQVTVDVHGVARRRLVRRGLLPFLRRGAYDAAQLRVACNAIRDDFQRRGHYHVAVRCDEEAHPADDDEGREELRVEIAVESGPVMKVDTLAFEGNETFSAATLAALMSTSEARPLRTGTGRLVRRALDDDLDAIRSFYVLQGFADVVVGPARISEQHETSPPTLDIAIPIVEGARRRVVGVRVEDGGVLGAEAITAPPLEAGGGPFHDVLLEESRNRLRARYEDAGYPEVTIDSTLDWSDDGTLVDVDLTIDPGPRSVVDRVIVRGTYDVRARAVRRVIGLESGDVVSRRRLLEVERDLHRLGVFTDVDVRLRAGARPDGKRDVIVELEEGRPWRLGYGLSYDSEAQAGGIFSVSRIDPFRRAGRLQLDLRGNRDEQRYRLLFDQPSLGARGLGLTYTLFFQNEDRRAFAVTDRGLQVALRKELGRTRYTLVYDYRLVDQRGIIPALPEVDRQQQEVQISSLTPTLFVDRRNDPFDPTSGWTTFVQLEHAFPLAEANASFVKLFWQQTGFARLGRWGTLAFSARVGALEALDDTVALDPLVPDGLASAQVPISERFFAGGRTSHRAYERDQLGIPDVTLIDIAPEGSAVPRFAEIGGNGLALINLDYRFPIAGAFGGTVFVDAGNVWADWRDVDPADAKLGIGLGLRYRSPIGPLRFELGWKLDPEPGERNPVILLSFGNPF